VKAFRPRLRVACTKTANLIPVPDRIGLAALAELGSRKSTEALQKPRVIVSLVSKHRLRPRFNPFWSWY
jgi:hypothetical protein